MVLGRAVTITSKSGLPVATHELSGRQVNEGVMLTFGHSAEMNGGVSNSLGAMTFASA